MREISDILEMVRSMGFSNGESYLLLSVRFSLPKDCLREKCDCRAEAATEVTLGDESKLGALSSEVRRRVRWDGCRGGKNTILRLRAIQIIFKYAREEEKGQEEEGQEEGQGQAPRRRRPHLRPARGPDAQPRAGRPDRAAREPGH